MEENKKFSFCTIRKDGSGCEHPFECGHCGFNEEVIAERKKLPLYVDPETGLAHKIMVHHR